MTATAPRRDVHRPAASAGPLDLVLLALWCGILAGVAELLVLGFGRYVRREIVFTGRDVIWMAPAAGAALFAPIGAALALAARRRPSLPSWPLALAVLGSLLFFGSLIRIPELHWAASLLLAVGLGVQVARPLSRRTAGFVRLVRRTTPWLLGLVPAIALGLHGWLALRERRALAALPAAPDGAPNVLLIILDTVRAMNLGLYGYHRPTTPNIDRWARGGVVFQHALSPSSWTLPSHASLFTGRWVHELGTDWNRALDDRFPTLAERLRAHGYATAGFVANVAYASGEVGVARGFIHYEDYLVTPRRTIECIPLGRLLTQSRRVQRFLNEVLGWQGSRKSGRTVNRQFLDWLDRSDSSRPFFVFLNYIDVHDNVVLPRFRRRFEADSMPPVARPYPHRWTRREATRLVAGYDEALLSLDAHVGALLDSLAARGLLGRTLVVLSSDHGHEFAEHGLVSHGNTLYRPSLEVPLVLAWPGRVPAGRRVATPVSLRDLPATILDLTGMPAHGALPGRSLARLWSGDDPGVRSTADTLLASVQRVWNLPGFYPAMQGDMHSVLFGGLRYIKNLGTGGEELYDFETDTLELHDLAGTPRGRAALPAYREALAALLGTGARSVAGRRPGPPASRGASAGESRLGAAVVAGVHQQEIMVAGRRRDGADHDRVAHGPARGHRRVGESNLPDGGVREMDPHAAVRDGIDDEGLGRGPGAVGRHHELAGALRRRGRGEADEDQAQDGGRGTDDR